MRSLIFLFFISVSVLSSAQTGSYFLSHYSPGKDRLDNVCFQIAQHENGLMYFATRRGVMQFDGKSWDFIPGNGAIYVLNVTPDGTVFWAGANGFGQLVFDLQGKPQLEVVSDSVKNVFQSSFLGETSYLLTEDRVYILGPDKKITTSVHATESTGSLTGIFELFGSIYINTSKGGILRISDGRFVTAALGIEEPVLFANRFGDLYLIGLNNNKLFIGEKGKKPRELRLEDHGYLSRSVIVSAAWLTRELIAVGTLRGGVVFINALTGKTHEIVNYAKGLPDNEVFALYNDRSQSIWAAHEYGFTRVAPYIPFRSFNHYSGLQGNILCSRSVKNTVYVGTSLGLFKLEKEEVYENVTIYEEQIRPRDRRRQRNAETEQSKKTSGVEGTDSKRKGFLGLFKRKASAETSPQTNEKSNTAQEQERVTARPKIKRVERNVRMLTSSTYTYKKVNGIDAKITQLEEVNGTLIASGLGGTYHINGLSAKNIQESPARFIYASKNHLYISTYGDELKLLSLRGGTWVKEDLISNLSDPITTIFEGNNSEVWLCGLEKIYRLGEASDVQAELEVFDIDNPGFDQFTGIPWQDRCILVNARGFYTCDLKAKKFIRSDSISDESLSNYFASGNTIWYRDNHGWKAMGANADSKAIGMLNLFQNIRFLSPDKNSNDLWIVTGNNQLYKFYGDRISPYSSSFPILIKSAKNGNVEISSGAVVVRLEQENSSVALEVVQPDYVASESIEYRYRLQGLDQTWTDWSQANSSIEIPYLPSGDYQLEVEARDIFGSLKTMPPVELIVVPPYWKRPWFYALEALLFLSLVILSFRLSTRYRIVSRLLMLLTLIMLIQFIETMAGQTFETKTSPVIDFFLQVIIAMVILPIEGYLRDLMLRSLESKHRFYKFISPRGTAREEDE